ncbi:Sulfate permease family [Fragilaria crotonensis]|nr:Sulfate permease family [Fragilaria crotonensis]
MIGIFFFVLLLGLGERVCAFNVPHSSLSSTSPRLGRRWSLNVGDSGVGNSGISVLYKPPASPSPPSRVESIVSNAKTLLPDRNATDERRNRILQAGSAGLTTSLAMVPEAVAFSFVAGVNPLVGLWTTATLGFVAASLGGRAGICSSASGACSVVVAALCASHGPSYLSACALMAGILQVIGGIVGIGKFIRLVPHPVMLGFVNGLAIVMTKSQLVHFTTGGKFMSLTSNAGASLYGVTALTMALVKVMPKITKVVPPSLGAVVVSALVSKLLNLPIKTLADVAGAATFRGGWSVLPKICFPAVPFSFATLQTVFPYAATMAAVGIIESLLTMQIVDGMVDDGRRGSTKRECIGQGCGNLLSGLTGGIGGCALLGQSIINVQSGGSVSRFSGMSMALFLAVGIVAFAPLLGAIPIASLAGVMLLVCQSTFSWSSLRLMRKIPRLDALVIALVSVATVQKDLAFAVSAGMVASALGFAWKQSTTLTANNALEGSKKLYLLNGPLFFGTTSQFHSVFDPNEDPTEVILDFTNSRVMDHSALVAINAVADRYGSRGKKVYLRHLSSDCTILLTKLDGGELPPYEIIEADPSTDPVYGVAEESGIYANVPVATA